MTAFVGGVIAADLNVSGIAGSPVGGWAFECGHVAPADFLTFPASTGGGSAVPDESPGGVAIF